MAPLLINGTDSTPKEVLDLVQVRLGQRDLSLDGLKPFRAGSELGLQPFQFSLLLSELSFYPIQLFEERLLFSRCLLRLPPLPVQLPLDLVEFFALVAQARRGLWSFFGCEG